MEIAQLRSFRAIADTLSFTRAAARVHLTQSAVSHQMKALEEELGEPLFIRAKRGVRLSDAGRMVLEHVDRILEETDALRERFSGQRRTQVGRVRLAAATQAFVHLFAPLCEAFMRLHDGIEVSFRTTVSTDQTVADILGGSAEVGFASLPLHSPSLQVIRLFDDELAVIVGRTHRLSRRKTVQLADIRNERLILFERGGSIRRTTDQFFKKAGFTPAQTMESNDTAFIKLMVEHGMGISLLPTWAVRDEVHAGRITQLSVVGYRLRRTVAMISLGRFLSSPTRTFVDFVKRHRQSLALVASTNLD